MMFMDMICNIVIMMGGTFVCILVFRLDLPSTMGLVSLADAGVKIALCIPRFRSGKWMNYVT